MVTIRNLLKMMLLLNKSRTWWLSWILFWFRNHKHFLLDNYVILNSLSLLTSTIVKLSYFPLYLSMISLKNTKQFHLKSRVSIVFINKDKIIFVKVNIHFAQLIKDSYKCYRVLIHSQCIIDDPRPDIWF